MAPIEAGEMRPYSVWKSSAWSPAYWSIARRSLESSRRRPSSSAILKTSERTPLWISLRLKSRLRRSGPMSLTVVRTGWPCSPKMSQKVTGRAVEGVIAELEQLDPVGDLGRGRPGLADARTGRP